MNRYGNIDFIMNLDAEDGIEIIKKAYEKQTEKTIWDIWISKYQWMDKESYISFDDFKKLIMKDTVKNTNLYENKEEIIRMTELIKKADQKGGKKNGYSFRTY